MAKSMTGIIFGVLIIVVGLVLESTILNQAAAAGVLPAMGSFGGAKDLNDLVPLVYVAAVVTLGVGLIGISAKRAFDGEA